MARRRDSANEEVPSGAPWCPWVAAERGGVVVRTDLVAELLGGALCAWRGDQAIVVLSPMLQAHEQRVALAHELIHLERGGGIDLPGMPVSWDAVVAREEAAVDAEVARRLVPPRALLELGESSYLEAPEVASCFEVTIEVAERAMRHALTPASIGGGAGISGVDPWPDGRCWRASSGR